LKHLILALTLLFAFSHVQDLHAYRNNDLVFSKRLYHIRKHFDQAESNLEKTEAMQSYIREEFSSDPEQLPPVILAYYAASEALMAKHHRNPIKVLGYLKRSVNYIDQAVALQADHLEVRFVRFSTFHHIPAVFGIGKRRGQDLDVICKLLVKKDYARVDRLTQEGMIDFMLDSRRLNREQSLQLEALKEPLK